MCKSAPPLPTLLMGVCLCVLCSYMFDEPSSYLDVKQRLKAAIAIRNLLSDNKLVPLDIRTQVVIRLLFAQVCDSGGARLERAGLPLRLHLLSVRSAWGLRCGDPAHRSQGGHQHLPGWLHPSREPALQGHQFGLQGFRAGRQGEREKEEKKC